MIKFKLFICAFLEIKSGCIPQFTIFYGFITFIVILGAVTPFLLRMAIPQISTPIDVGLVVVG
ncbi:MAG: hypothetical protein MJY54_03315 [archaeon]|nr:hypothetical protein [archaeon]